MTSRPPTSELENDSLKKYLFYACACVSVSVCACMLVPMEDRRGLKLQAIGSHRMTWVLGTELWSSVSAINVLKHRTIFSYPQRI